MHLIYEALKKTGGKTDGESLIAAAKGMAWESPRGPISIDPETRDIVQTVYIRRVEKVGGNCSTSSSTRWRTSRIRRALQASRVPVIPEVEPQARLCGTSCGGSQPPEVPALSPARASARSAQAGMTDDYRQLENGPLSRWKWSRWAAL